MLGGRDVEKDVDGGCFESEVTQLVRVAGISSVGKVRQNAHTLHNLRQSLAWQAACVRQLHPLIMGPNSQNLMLEAGARHWRH